VHLSCVIAAASHWGLPPGRIARQAARALHLPLHIFKLGTAPARACHGPTASVDHRGLPFPGAVIQNDQLKELLAITALIPRARSGTAELISNSSPRSCEHADQPLVSVRNWRFLPVAMDRSPGWPQCRPIPAQPALHQSEILMFRIGVGGRRRMLKSDSLSDPYFQYRYRRMASSPPGRPARAQVYRSYSRPSQPDGKILVFNCPMRSSQSDQY